MLKSLLFALRAAFVKKKGEYRYYLLDYIVGLLIKFVFFVAMLIAYPETHPLEGLVRISCFILWYLAAHVLAKMSNVVVEEAYLGTLAQILTTKTSLLVYLVAHTISEVVMSFIWILGFIALAVFLMPFGAALAQLSLWQVGMAFVVVLVALIGIVGMGIFLFGLSIKFKQVGSISELLIFVMLLFSGFFIPPNYLPHVLIMVNFVSPLWWAFDLLHRIVLGELVQLHPYLLTQIAVSAVWIAAGVIVTNHFLYQAKIRGTLLNY
jgi:ABC-2 type transport system permease protein